MPQGARPEPRQESGLEHLPHLHSVTQAQAGQGRQMSPRVHTEQSRRAGQAAGRGQALIFPGRPAAQARRGAIVLEALLGRRPVVVSSVCRGQDQGPTLLYCLHWAYSTHKPRDQGEEVCNRDCSVWRLQSQLMEGQDCRAGL